MSPFRRIWNAIRRRQLDDEIRQEVDTHLALIEDEERANGASDGGARRHARTRFGSALAHREQALDGVMATTLESAWKEIVFALRRLLRSPAFTVAAVLTLALAIGANAAIFAVVERVLLNPLPYPESDRLIDVTHDRHASQSGADHGHHARLLFPLPRTRPHTRRHRAVRHDRRDVDRQRRPAAHQGDPRDDVVRQRHAGVAGSGALVY